MNYQNLRDKNGKPLMKSYINAMTKAEKFGFNPDRAMAAERANPFSGVSHNLEPLAVAMFDFIVGQYHRGNVGKLFPVSVWDSMRYAFLSMWPDQYYDLID